MISFFHLVIFNVEKIFHNITCTEVLTGNKFTKIMHRMNRFKLISVRQLKTFQNFVDQVLRVATCQGNVRKKLNFLQVKEKMSGNFGI